MESDSDGDIEFSGMELPPLINSLKRILSEYPDGGQIIKELIQNAEDAGATEVKLLYDGRNINQDTAKDKAFRQFFSGPALCVYNNAVFEPADWKGIRMIDMSTKEGDPLKVGKFGLGFKSVFHLTDYPCILSGAKLLLIDPQQSDSRKVNARMDVKKLLTNKKRVDVDAFLTALDGTFGVSNETIKKGMYNGTLFWFPLRQTPSKISSNLYNEEKVMALFKAFEAENESLLIFLKSLTRISLSRRSNGRGQTDMTIVEIQNAEAVQKERKVFKERVNSLSANPLGPAVHNTLEIIVQCTNSPDQEKYDQPSVRTWLVVNYFMGSNASPGFMALIQDKDFASSPYVSVGAPLPIEPNTGPLEGHVFCFLPLPREGTSLTGLPVHVNGFFALNQSRHHVKWLTDEQKQQLITDKDVLWNKHLITEALPIAYDMWIKKAVQLAKHHDNSSGLVACVHNAIPVRQNVVGKWRKLLKPLFKNLENDSFLYSTGEQKWVQSENAMFTSPKEQLVPTHQKTLVELLSKMGKQHVDIGKEQVDTLHHFLAPNLQPLLTPQLLSTLLREDTVYQSLDATDKMCILQYLLKDGVYSNVEGLQLIPVASGRWTTFSDDVGEKIYTCSTTQLRLFPGLEDRFLLQESQFPGDSFCRFDSMCEQGMFQLRKLCDDESDIATLLQKAMEIQSQPVKKKGLKLSRTFNIKWLQEVWLYITAKGIGSICRRVALLPITEGKNWDNPKVETVQVSDMMILAEHGTSQLPDEVCSCLRTLGVCIVPSLPDWIPASTLTYLPEKEHVVKLLTLVEQSPTRRQRDKIIKEFNKLDVTSRVSFMLYLVQAKPVEGACLSLLKKLKMFPGRDSPVCSPTLYSVHDGYRFTTVKQFPIRYPQPLLDGSNGVNELLGTLGVQEINPIELIISTLQNISRYDKPEIRTFMEFLVQNFHEIQTDNESINLESIINLARVIPFIKCGREYKTPSDLFNPTDAILKDMFIGETVFPERKYPEKSLRAMSFLGLKGREHVSAQSILTTATLLDTWSRSNTSTKNAAVKGRALKKILEMHPEFLNQSYNGRLLKDLLSDLECIEFETSRVPGFPKWLPWYSSKNILCKPSEAKDITLANIVGSVIPVVKTESKAVSDAFDWTKNIEDHVLITQMKQVRECFQVRHEADLLVFLRTLYEWLKNNEYTIETWTKERMFWVRNGFAMPEQIIISKATNDLHLEPYIYQIGDTFTDLSSLFLDLGCHRKQSTDVLLTTLTQISKQQSVQTTDLSLSVSIIQRLAERITELSSDQREQLPLPVYSNGATCFKPLIECTYTDSPDKYLTQDANEESGYDIDYFLTLNLVTKDISEHTAKALSVKSPEIRNFVDTEGITFEEYGQEEELTTRLKRLIEEGYRDGLSVPKELLQNADDAGAKHLKFLYDERDNLDAQESLLDKGMRNCQGSALWVYNDACFTDEDFVNIRKLSGATKENNAGTIGKFGLGFCSVYNLTDVPSFVSGTNIVILDPHKSHLENVLPGNSPGLKIDLSLQGNKRLLKINKDQFKPFYQVFECDLSGNAPCFNGTLFRLPLRTQEEARTSKIRQYPYTKHDIVDLLRLFVSNAGNLLLFTQNVQSIEFYYLPSYAESTREQTLVFRVDRNCFQFKSDAYRLMSENVLSRLAANPGHLSEIQKVCIQLEERKSFEGDQLILEQSHISTSTIWCVSWATGTGESKRLATGMKGALPLAAIAVPCEEGSGCPKEISHLGKGFFNEGKLYCFLPISASTETPWHLHGCFDVTSDRRQLKVDTDQDKSSPGNHWNKMLMSDAAVNAFINMLIYFTKIPRSGPYTYTRLWPVHHLITVQPFVQGFFSKIVRDDVRIFEGHDGAYHSFSKIIFLDERIRRDHDIGDIAFDMLATFIPRSNYFVVDMSTNVVESLQQNNDQITNDQIQRQIIGMTELLTTFMENIDMPYWNSRTSERNKFILYSLNINSDEAEKMLERSKCIPSEHLGTLKRPNELIHPGAAISSMFSSSDGLFPVNESGFRDVQILQKLVSLGMVEQIIPIELLVERCRTVEKLAVECSCCALERIQSILTYLSMESVLKGYSDNDIIRLREIYWLPVMSKPSEWKFSWYSDSCKEVKRFEGSRCHQHAGTSLTLGKPEQLHRQKDKAIFASVACIVDENDIQVFSNVFWQKLDLASVDTKHHFQKVVDQLCILSEEYNNNPNYSCECFNDVYHKIVKFLNSALLNDDSPDMESRCKLEGLCNRAVVLVNDEKLVPPLKVAESVQEDCYPYLCKLPKSECLFKEFYRAIGVRHHFAVVDVVNAIQECQGETTHASHEEVKDTVKLLQNLVESMELEGNAYDSYTEFHDSVKGPDIDGNYFPTYMLAMEDETFTTDVDVKLMHGDIPMSLAEQLGIKSKKQSCIDAISFGVPWGQRESLVTRLQGLLKDHPCDHGIMKELLQNSDDANAKELHFIKDYRNHPTNKILGSDHLQGPALCVYNDSYFTEEDLKGLQHLGIGSKQSEPSKSGQFGVGFNAVYHLTDTPSFMTRSPECDDTGLICILDPLCKNVPVNESNPGLICPVDKMKENFPDVMFGYLENDGFFQSGKGTMFRFPLRKEKSGISPRVIKTDELDTLLDSFIEEMLDVLLFVKSLKTIKVSYISSSTLIHEYTLHVSISDREETERNDFFNLVKATADKNKQDLSNNLKEESKEIVYTLQLEDSKRNKQKWLIVQRFGCLKDFVVDESVGRALRKHDICHLPIGGIAVPYADFEALSHQLAYSDMACEEPGNDFNSPKKRVFSKGETSRQTANQKTRLFSEANTKRTKNEDKHLGKFYSVLPLPVRTGFLVHINGHFCLDHSRRDLWNEGYRKAWNDLLGSAVIVPAWIRAIIFMQKYFDSKKMSEVHVKSETGIAVMMECYHSLFPLLNQTEHQYSKDIVRSFYELVLKDECKLFPLVKKECQGICVSWLPLKDSKKMFGAVFNDIISHLLERTTGSSKEGDIKKIFQLVEDILKDVGLSLIETPLSILETIETLDILPVPTASPTFVIQFLKSFKSGQAGACVIGEINTPVEKTRLKSIQRVEVLIEYVSRADQFPSDAEGLPLLLTADSLLHQFSCDSEIYHCRHSSLLPESRAVFVHEEILKKLDKKKFNDVNLLKILDVEGFRNMLRKESLDEMSSGRIVSWNKKEKEFITPDWIDGFFRFIAKKSKKKNEHDLQKFGECISTFNEWSFLPAVYGPEQNKLLPISLACCLFDDRQERSTVSGVLRKIRLPALDETIFSKNSIKEMVKSILAHTGRPKELLRCLATHKEKIVKARLSKVEAETLLVYFDGHVNDIQSRSNRDWLRSLPLYSTFQGKLVELEGDVLVLPKGIPDAGMQDWALRFRMTLLRQTDRLSNLYKFLELVCLDADEFYSKTLVPAIDLLPPQSWLVHIQYMKQILNACDFRNSQYAELLLTKLKALPFIDVGNNMKRPCDLYWPDKEGVFSIMLKNEDFPPQKLQTDEWEDFFKRLGMKFEVTDQLLLKFATAIESSGKRGISTLVEQQSQVLLSCFLGGRWKDNTLYSIKSVKFVCPYKVGSELACICKQYDSGFGLIAFENAVPARQENLCWTSLNLIKTFPINTNEDTLRELGIHIQPPVQKVICHIKNVCPIFHERVKLGTADTSIVEAVMTEVYEYLSKNHYTTSFSLRNFPLIFLPCHGMFVQPSTIVTGLERSQELPPYLYKAPAYFGRYFEFFVRIGAYKEINIDACMYVLETITIETAGEALIPYELKVTADMIMWMVKILKDVEDETEFRQYSRKTLYLPNKQKKMVDSKQLTVSDVGLFESLLGNKVSINYFIGFEALKLQQTDPCAMLRKLPKGLRPTILSDVVDQRMCLEEMTLVENSQKAEKLELFLHSQEFIQAVLRLVKHNRSVQGKAFDEKDVLDVTKRIESTKVYGVHDLNTVLVYKGDIISETKRQTKCFVKENSSGKFIFYFSEGMVTRISSDVRLTLSLIKLIKECTHNGVGDGIMLPMILSRIDEPSLINSDLDEFGIGQFRVSHSSADSAFPKPGERVERRLHRLLKQAVVPVRVEEYDCLVLKLVNTEDYMHVIIREKIEGSQNRYLVDTGFRPERVPLARLYRFTRRT